MFTLSVTRSSSAAKLEMNHHHFARQYVFLHIAFSFSVNDEYTYIQVEIDREIDIAV